VANARFIESQSAVRRTDGEITAAAAPFSADFRRCRLPAAAGPRVAARAHCVSQPPGSHQVAARHRGQFTGCSAFSEFLRALAAAATGSSSQSGCCWYGGFEKIRLHRPPQGSRSSGGLCHPWRLRSDHPPDSPHPARSWFRWSDCSRIASRRSRVGVEYGVVAEVRCRLSHRRLHLNGLAAGQRDGLSPEGRKPGLLVCHERLRPAIPEVSPWDIL
jgi:hypothetical protein